MVSENIGEEIPSKQASRPSPIIHRKINKAKQPLTSPRADNAALWFYLSKMPFEEISTSFAYNNIKAKKI